MKTKIKIAAGMLAGIVAGTMIVGTAFAAPNVLASPAFNGYGMMRSVNTSGTFDVPTIAEMNTFMNQYRTANGSIDVNRMHADVASGKVTPTCLTGNPSTKGASSQSQAGQTSYRRGPAMMQGLSTDGSSASYKLMGSTY